MLPIGSSSRRLLNQSTHSSVAYSKAWRWRQGRRHFPSRVIGKPLTNPLSSLVSRSTLLIEQDEFGETFKGQGETVIARPVGLDGVGLLNSQECLVDHGNDQV
jgi:hypothetical protein